MSPEKKYDWDAKDYQVNSQNQFFWAKELLTKLKLSGDETVLDIGCGEGKITEELAMIVPKGRVIGIDSSKQMIQQAKSNFTSKQQSNLRFKLMDAQKLTFQEEFDVAFSNAALHWILNQKRVLAGVKRSLKPGGRLLFQMAGKGNAKAILDILAELLSSPYWRPYFENFTFPYAFLSPEEYKILLSEAGLTVVRAESIPKDMKFDNAAGLAGWIRTTWLPYTQRLPQQQQTKFIDEIAQTYLQLNPPDAKGITHLGMVRLEVEAKKS
jgi:trans-aconitate 2-methyltransferase